MVKSVPAAITADTGLDVLAHALEAYVSTEADYFSDMYAEKATSLCKHYLVRSYNYQKTRESQPRKTLSKSSKRFGTMKLTPINKNRTEQTLCPVC